MLFARVATRVVAAGTIVLLGACQSVGPIEIGAGRDRYNSILQSTGKVQTLANIVRAQENEQTLFMDVTEVDAGTTFTGTLAGSISGIGAKAGTSGGTLAGQVGSITPGVTYTEAPFIRYIPLVGQGLVSQLVTPVGVDALESLYHSGWSTAVVLDMATYYLVPDPRYNAAAANIISLLVDDYYTATLVAEKSELTSEQSLPVMQQRGQATTGGNSGVNNSSKPAADDALTIFLQPPNPGAPPTINERTLYWWRQLLAIYGPYRPHSDAYPVSIELRTVAVKADQKNQKKKELGLWTRAPVLKTYSALGILQNASIAFVTPTQAQEIRGYPWTKYGTDFYTLPATSDNIKGSDSEVLSKKLTEWIDQAENLPENRRKDRLLLYEPVHNSKLYDDPVFIRGNEALARLRRYILIVMDDTPPPDAYVAYFHEGKWYYIDGDDKISKDNFNLIALFLTVMAVPSSTPPVGTTISVGGG